MQNKWMGHNRVTHRVPGTYPGCILLTEPRKLSVEEAQEENRVSSDKYCQAIRQYMNSEINLVTMNATLATIIAH